MSSSSFSDSSDIEHVGRTEDGQLIDLEFMRKILAEIVVPPMHKEHIDISNDTYVESNIVIRVEKEKGKGQDISYVEAYISNHDYKNRELYTDRMASLTFIALNEIRKTIPNVNVKKVHFTEQVPPFDVSKHKDMPILFTNMEEYRPQIAKDTLYVNLEKYYTNVLKEFIK